MFPDFRFYSTTLSLTRQDGHELSKSGRLFTRDVPTGPVGPVFDQFSSFDQFSLKRIHFVRSDWFQPDHFLVSNGPLHTW